MSSSGDRYYLRGVRGDLRRQPGAADAGRAQAQGGDAPSAAGQPLRPRHLDGKQKETKVALESMCERKHRVESYWSKYSVVIQEHNEDEKRERIINSLYEIQ